MLRIIFYSINGVGMGHAIRGINIAKALRKIIECEIIFATNSPFNDIFEKEGFAFVKGGADPIKLYTGEISHQEYLQQNEEFFISVIKKLSPHIVVFDLLIMPKVLAYMKEKNIFSVYVLRELSDTKYLSIHRNFLSNFDLTLLTCIEDERFIKNIRECGFDQNKFFYIGNIFRTPKLEQIKKLKQKYNKKKDELLVTITAGGGGFLKGTHSFFSNLGIITKKVENEFRNKKNDFKKIRWLLIKGPLFNEKIDIPKHIEVSDYEQHLPELFAISDLIISAAGYNSVNEIIAAQTPALLHPFFQIMDSQALRAFFYTSKGFIQTFNAKDIRKTIKIFLEVINPTYLNEMKQSYQSYVHKNGKNFAAAIILSEFSKSYLVKKKVGVLRIDSDNSSEFFLKEELRNLTYFKPLYLCGKTNNKNQNNSTHIREDFSMKLFKSMHLPVFSAESMENFYQAVQQENVLLLHAQFLTDSISYLPLIKKAYLPVIASFRGYELSDSRIDLFFTKLEPFVSKVVTKSKFQERALVKRGIQESKIEVIYGGIDVEMIPFKFRDINKKSLKFLSAGRYVEKKGFFVLLKSFKKVLETYPFARLTLIINSTTIGGIRESIDDLGIEDYVEIKKFMPHPKFIRELFYHDIFVLLSQTATNGDSEGVPNVLKEAMASGMPIISTYHAGIPELIEDGKTGFLIKENDTISLQKKVDSMLKDLDKILDICLNARFLIEKKFNIKKTTRTLESLYNRILEPGYIRTIEEVLTTNKPFKFRADLHLISGCNGKCIMCDNYKNDIVSDFSQDKALRLLDDLKVFGVDHVRFHGQEPTLRKDLFSLMKAAKEKGFKVGLKTNSLFFDDLEKVKKLSQVVDDLYLSLESSDEKIHNLLRRNKESFARNIKITKAIKGINPRVKVYYNAVVTKYNYKTIASLLDLANSLRVSKVSFVHLNTNNKKNITTLKLDKEELEDFYFKIWPDILKKSERFNIPVNVDPYFSFLTGLSIKEQVCGLEKSQEKLKSEIDNFFKGLYGKKFYSQNTCYGVLDHVTIDWKGNVYPCCAMPRSQSGSVGNVGRKKFSDIWNSRAYKDYRQQVLNGECKFKDKCGRNFKQTKQINNHIRKKSDDDYKNIILDKFLSQFRHNDYLNRYKATMMLYYAFSKSQFYYEKFKDYLCLGGENRFSELPFVTREELKNAKDVMANYFKQDYGIFRTSSCGQNAFSYARSLDIRHFPLMATCFLNTGKWKLGSPWLKLTALNCIETAYPLTVKLFSGNEKEVKEGETLNITPSENFIKEPFSNIKSIYNLIKESASRLIHANPTYLKLLLYRFKKEGLGLVGQYAVNSTYELLLPSTKKIIEECLDCQIYDQYGCSEIGPISFTCQRGNNHLFSDSVFVEVIPAKDIGRDDIGRVVATDLNNKVMPFVKYFTGDFAYIIKNKECSCGLNTPLIGKILGREDEMIDYEGKVVFPLEIDSLFYDLSSILIYQVKFKDNQFFIKLVPFSKIKKSDLDKIIKRFIDYFGIKKQQVDIEVCSYILPSRRGKYRTVVI